MKSILTKIVDEFKTNTEIEAIVLSGSVSSNCDDELSDYDIYIYSKNVIDTKFRKNIAEKFADTFEINNEYWENGDGWLLRNSNKQIDIMFRSIDWIEAQIRNVWINHQASVGYSTCFLYNVKYSKIFYDKDGWFANMQAELKNNYPQELEQNIINKNFPILKDILSAPYTEQIKNAVRRNDLVSVNHRITAFIASYFDVLFAKNHLLHPGEKRLVCFAVKNCTVLPKDFEQNMNKIFTVPLDSKVDILYELAEGLREIL